MKPFHGDEYLLQMVQIILEKLSVTSFVETGTGNGYTTEFIVSHYNLPIFTCDIDEERYQLAKARLQQYLHVEIKNCSSEKYIQELIERRILGELPFFFLDAHPTAQPELKYIPLPDEVKLIGSLSKAIILIDDFELPSQPQFGYNVYTGKIIGVEMIESSLGEENDYEFLIPVYTLKNMPKNIYRGHVFIFQNAGDCLEKIMGIPFVKENYKLVSIDELK